MKGSDGTARAVGLAVFAGNHQGGLAVALHHPCGDYANDAAMPAFAVEDEAVGIELRGIPLQTLLNLFHDALLLPLAVSVELVELLGQLARPGCVANGKQLNDVAGYIHASGSVQARRNAESHVAAGEAPLARRQIGDFQKRFQPWIDRRAQTLKPQLGENPVFAAERD